MFVTGSVSILIVEDSENDLLLMLRILRASGLTIAAKRVETIPAAREALCTATWDIILCDHRLPLIDVDATLDLVKTLAPGVPVVLVSGAVGEEAVAELMRRGIADVVLKDRIEPRLAATVMREVAYARQRRSLDIRRRHIETVLSLFNAATDWREALEASLAHLGQHFRGALAIMWEVNETTLTFREIASWCLPRFAPLRARVRQRTHWSARSRIGQSVLHGEPHFVPNLKNFPSEDAPLLLAMIGHGILGHVSQPLEAGGRRFSFVMVFDEVRDDLESVMAELSAISSSLQPALVRKLIEHERNLLRNALDATQSGVIITETTLAEPKDHQIVYVNKAICQMSGYEPNLLLGDTPRILQGPRTDLATCARVRRAIDASEPIRVDIVNHRNDGTPYDVDMDISPVNEPQQASHFVAILTDITDRRRAEQTRQEQEASFRLMFESNPLPMWLSDSRTQAMLEVNNAAVARYGWSRDEFLAKTVADIRAPESRAEPDADSITQAAEPMRDIHVTATGERLIVREFRSRIDYRGRRADLAVIWDVTEIERAREELRRNNEVLAEVTDRLTARTADLVNAARLAQMGLWSMDFEPLRIDWSPETFAILGRAAGAFRLTARNILACVHPEDREHFRNGYRRMRASGTNHQIEYRVIRPSGEIRFLREIARPKLDPDGAIIGIAGVVQDITEHKAAQDALLRSEKLKTIGLITGGIAHDFNNLLTVIKLNIDSALRDTALSPDVRSTLRSAWHATQRSGELTRAMLSYARRQSLRPQIVDLQALVETMEPLLSRVLTDQHVLKIAPRSTTRHAELDAGQFENALMNLVINARDALADRGRIDVSVTMVQTQQPLTAFPDTVPPGDYLRVRVSDTGRGILPEILPKIFEPFFTTKPEGAGTGLGLSMVLGFTHQSKGGMTITTQPGVGTNIELYFPAVAESADQQPALPPAQTGLTAKARRVLILEDREDLRKTVHRIFVLLGFETVSVARADEALARLRSGERIDLLFTDVAIDGDTSGLQVATQAAILCPAISVVLTTGNVKDMDVAEFGWPLLPKPFDVDALVEVLKIALP